MYGRDVRGPLDVLQEGWIGEQQDSQDDVLRLMDTMLRGSEEYTGVYLDDVVLIYGTEWGEHLQTIETVFQKLQEAGHTSKLKKCSFGIESCTCAVT